MRRSDRSPRERMLSALNCQVPDHVPCSFMIFGALHQRSASYLDFVERQVEMGLDAFVELPPRPPVVVNDHYNLHGLPVNYDPHVSIEEWVEEDPEERAPVMVKEYRTPAGVLRTEVQQTEDWRWGDHVPFLDDYLVPRSKKFLVTEPADLEPLRYLLVPPTREEIAAFRAQSQPALELAQRYKLLVAGGWGVGADLIGWIHGLEEMILAPYDQPDFVHDLLEVIAVWNRQRMAILLDTDPSSGSGPGIDLYIKRAWYESCAFWTPSTFRAFLFPILKADVDLAHERGAKFGYIITSDVMPLLDMLAEAGVDVVIGVDPMTWDMAAAKRKLAGKVCLWGGVNGHLTVEEGTPSRVRAEVREAIEVLGPDGFVLSPVDNVREDTPQSRANVAALIEEWQLLTGQLPNSRVTS